MPEGGKLTIATRVVILGESDRGFPQFETKPGTYLSIRVSDTGTGISEETRKRLFEPFFTTKEPGKGTGMGLAAVYGTVKSHEGMIRVESELGRGSTFDLYLPLAAECEGSLRETLSEFRGSNGSHVLVVDDEETIREVASSLLSKLGYRVTACCNGAEAVSIYKEKWREVNLVLLDVVMPVMDGEEAYAAMRAINPDIVALVSSGYSLDNQAQRIMAMGAKGFIQKPYRLHELEKKLREIVSQAAPEA
jgi:CheY-like chemotaxis protein